MLTHLAPSDSRPSRVLILGRSGFLAKYLAAELARADILFEAIGRPAIDLTERSSVEQLSRVVRSDDVVVILSALTPDKGRDFRTLMKNLGMAEHLAELFDRVSCAHIVYVSSDAVYDGRQGPIDETSGREPADLYGLMHTAREMMLQSVAAARQIPFCIVRPVALFGAGDTHNSYGPNRFVREAIEHRSITLFGEGEDERSHLDVADAARLMTRCISRGSTGVLNLATPEMLSFRQVADMIRAACPFPVELKLKPRPGAGAPSRRPFATTGLHQAFPDFTFTPASQALQALVAAALEDSTART